MSYDVWTGDDSFNITSNMREMLEHYGAYPPSWDGRGVLEVHAEIQNAVRSISSTQIRFLQEWDAPNGWGDWLTTLRWLMEVRDSCAKAHMEKGEDAIVGVFW